METINLINLSQTGDKAARDRLVTENIGLVWSIVRRFMGRGHESEDLFQIGVIGLIKAIDKFDTGYDVRFSTYAVPMITGEIKRFLRDDGMIKVSRSLKEAAMKIKVAKEQFENKQGREPTVEEIGELLGMSAEDVAVALDACTDIESLYKTIYQGDGNAIYLIDKVEQREDDTENMMNQLTVDRLISTLNEKEQTIIKMRYYQEKTQTEIAELLGISQVQVSRLEKKILLSMKKLITV